MDLLGAALSRLPKDLQDEVILLVMGKPDPSLATNIPVATTQLGFVSEPSNKARVYSAADLFVLPTRADNLPVVLQESMSCGTPMVSFRVGGVTDLVRQEITGLTAEPEDSADLAEKIKQLLMNPAMRFRCAENCRKIAVDEYSLGLQGSRYRALFESISAN